MLSYFEIFQPCRNNELDNPIFVDKKFGMFSVEADCNAAFSFVVVFSAFFAGHNFKRGAAQYLWNFKGHLS